MRRRQRVAGERQGLRFEGESFVNNTPPRYEEVNDVNFFFGGGGQQGGQVQNMGVQPSCKEFVDNLVHLIRFNVNFTQRMDGGTVSRGINKAVLGIEMMNRAVKNVDIFGRSYVKGPGAPVGFKLDLVNNGQLGDVYHHIEFVAGATFLGSRGRSIVELFIAKDIEQAFNGRIESETELRDDEAGQQVGRAMVNAFDQREPNYNVLRGGLRGILCNDQ